MSFQGMWSGYTDVNTGAKVRVKISGHPNSLNGYALVSGGIGYDDVIEFLGKERDTTNAELSMTKYISSNLKLNLPSQLNINLSIDDMNREIEGNWSTDIGTSGELTLRRANIYENIILMLPIQIHIWLREVKKHLDLSNIYLLFVLLITILSIFGFTPEKLSATESTILLVPLIYLFLDKIIRILYYLKTVGLRKIGPLEFDTQARYEPNTIDEILTQLRQEFGQNYTYYLFLNSFFVPRTKALLKELSFLNRHISYDELAILARRLYIPETNIPITLEALRATQCILINEK